MATTTISHVKHCTQSSLQMIPFFFQPWIPWSLITILALLTHLKKAIGFNINHEKSEIIGINTVHEEVEYITNKFDCRQGQLPYEAFGVLFLIVGNDNGQMSTLGFLCLVSLELRPFGSLLLKKLKEGSIQGITHTYSMGSPYSLTSHTIVSFHLLFISLQDPIEGGTNHKKII